MKAITIHQPYAGGIAYGYKTHETRSWSTKHRGLIAIHASKNRKVPYQPTANILMQCPLLLEEDDTAFGAIVAVANLVDCVKMTPELIAAQNPIELALGGWDEGRYAWKLDNVCRLLVPLPIKGQQGLWNLPQGILPDWE